ncbi:MAG: Zn-finger nucleic acid-binding protein [Bacteroidia bacterium]|jgi:Zn-finger nucleic acid-binding protein
MFAAHHQEEVIVECPKCQSQFEKISFADIEVERCLGCRGLWFDMLEKEDLVKINGAEAIDIGDAQVGEKYSAVRDVSCPHCSVTMVPMVDKDQYHIKYESCPSCYGTFFDAGEFRDLKEHNVLERFTEMLKTLRTNL